MRTKVSIYSYRIEHHDLILTIKREGRCPMSGYPETYTEELKVDLDQAQRLHDYLSAVLPGAKSEYDAYRRECLTRREQQLESELKAVKGQLGSIG